MPDPADPPTIREVAAAAGVSVSSVSNYFHHPERMADATRERIRSAVETLDFAPNDAARRLRRGGSTVVGYISHELATARTPAITNAISRRLAGAGLQLLSGVDDGDADRERSYLQLFERQRVAGVVVTPVTDVEPELARLRSRGIASVLCAHRARGPEQASVSIDHVRGGRIAAEHLIATGRRRIAYVTDTLDLPQIADRHAGALRALRDRPDVRLEVVLAPARTVAGGESAARDLARRPTGEVPDAVLGVNDLVALGVVSGFAGLLSVPDDVAVVGYDDIEFARLGAVPLTTVRTPQEELGTTAAGLLLEEIASASAAAATPLPRPHVELQPELVVRASAPSD